jgi:hypothetical protein
MKLRCVMGLLCVLFLGGCTAVRPYQKGILADPIMSSADETAMAMRELKWLEAREGSTGGAGGAGGGCACK